MSFYQNDKPVTDSLFKNPPAVFRGAPFWAWNGAVKQEILQKQIDVFGEMGMGGFHIHPRIGLATPYLGKEYMDAVCFCNRYAREKGMLTWLYDEDKWPSGYGGGRVTQKAEYASKYLLFSTKSYENGEHINRKLPPRRITADGKVTRLQSYRIELEGGRLKHYKAGTEGNGRLWHAYLVVTDPLPWFNHSPYVDVLDPEAIKRFTQVTHEVYAGALEKEFSVSVPAIFTDEPQVNKVETLRSPMEEQEIGIPYNKYLEEAFQSVYHYSLLEHLPEIFWDAAGESSETRYHYHNVLSECFTNHYAGTIGGWCRDHGLLMTGHLMMEPTLDSQTRHVGEAMRAYREFGMPGIDMLADRHEYTTAKQAQSVGRQEGCCGVASELYGVTNWDFDFRGHKHQGDWQAAMGVTLRVPHLAWMYMGGESKRDYPAPIDAHSPWYVRYHIIEDHFARVNLAMTRGTPKVRIGVIHPIESYWLMMGPDAQYAGKRERLEENFKDVTEWLLFGLYDFDFIAESLLERQYGGIAEERLKVGHMEYEVIIVPELVTIRSSTLQILEEFRKQGGKIIFMGEIPSMVNAKLSEEPRALAEESRRIGFGRHELLDSLEPFRDIRIEEEGKTCSDRFLYQMREETGGGRWLFIANGKKEDKKQTENLGRKEFTAGIRVRIKGCYRAIWYDTMNGSCSEANAYTDEGETVIETRCYEQDSLLYRLEPRGTGQKVRSVQESFDKTQAIRFPVFSEYELEEWNCLLLDQPGYRLDRGRMEEPEEILRIDDKIRERLHFRKRTDSFPQPWLSLGAAQYDHEVELHYEIDSTITLKTVYLACEGERMGIMWNGAPAEANVQEHYIDTCIHKISLGRLKKGTNHLQINLPFGETTALERCYLLGNFGVRTFGSRSVIIARERKLAFGDYTRQGFPFYGGSLTYITKLITPKGRGILKIPEYSGALIDVSVDGERKASLFASPYEVDLGGLLAGEHEFRLTLYGNRYNMFGQLHNCDEKEAYWGPKTWRTRGESWTYSYRPRRMGILTEPILYLDTGENA